jgi:Xaa-Pro aminopeptidase
VSLVERSREVEDEGEISRIEAAAAIADAAFASVRHRLGEGIAERELAFELEAAMHALGADGKGLETIVASGPNGAKPHAKPSTRRIRESDLVVLDFGALVDGYRSDVTRTICVGEPTPTQQRMLEVVTGAQAAGVAAVAAGVSAAEVDRVCRSLIAEAGFGDAFLHTTGHSIGIDLHEKPWVEEGGDATLLVGHVITVEPGVYLREHGGVRVEDTVVVGVEGARALTRSTKDWRCDPRG